MRDAMIGGVPYARLEPSACARVHDIALGILERTGARLLEPRAVRLLADAGARVDGDHVWIPRELVAWALSVAPRSVTLHDRLGDPALELTGRRWYAGPGSDCLHILDHRTGERRAPTLADLREGIALVDALPNLDFIMSLFIPREVDGRVADRYQMAEMIAGTTKPIVLVSYEPSGMKDGLAMAEAVAGGADALRERPFVATYINVTRALLQGESELRKLLWLSERGYPFLWIPVTSGGTTGPVTLGATLALNTAGVLIGVVLSQLVREGAPIVIPGFGGDGLDLLTMVDPYAGPDACGPAVALAHWYGLPMFSLAGGSDAKVVDGQSAAEAALTLLAVAMGGGQLTHDCGYLESGLTGSLAQMAVCDEIVGWIRAATAPVDLSDEALALDDVDLLGIDGSFLETDHTLERFRERWYPSLFERNNHDGWRSRGGMTLAERASVRVDALLAAHEPAPLEPDVAASIRAILERAEATAGL
jgi:trimethylamine---corrinoid protein Co-methyltransferase